MSKICVLDKTGHTEAAMWEPGDVASMVVAQQTFDRLKSEGFAAFETSRGETVGVVDRFNPKADEIVFILPMVGG